MRLLPLLYKNLTAQGVDDPLLNRLKGIYRYTWADNQRILSLVPAVVEGFREKGIPCLLLKGAGLTATCYQGNFGVRTMTDLDLLIPEERIADALAWLHASGWKSTSIYRREYVPAHHAGNFRHRSGVDLDLHWHLLHQRAESRCDRLFWERAVAAELRGTECRTLCATDHLIHACVHGSHWDPVKTIRWVADAYVLVDKSAIDWERVVAMSAELEIIPLMQDMLGRLKTDYRAEIPQAALDALGRLKCPSWQRREFALVGRPRGFFGQLPMLWLRSTKRIDERGLLTKLPVFLDSLKSYYAVDDYAGVGRVLAQRTWNRLRGGAARTAPGAP
jgi:hypothetical protein